MFLSGVLGITGHLSDVQVEKDTFPRFQTRAMEGEEVSVAILIFR